MAGLYEEMLSEWQREVCIKRSDGVSNKSLSLNDLQLYFVKPAMWDLSIHVTTLRPASYISPSQWSSTRCHTHWSAFSLFFCLNYFSSGVNVGRLKCRTSMSATKIYIKKTRTKKTQQIINCSVLKTYIVKKKIIVTVLMTRKKYLVVHSKDKKYDWVAYLLFGKGVFQHGGAMELQSRQGGQGTSQGVGGQA